MKAIDTLTLSKLLPSRTGWKRCLNTRYSCTDDFPEARVPIIDMNMAMRVKYAPKIKENWAGKRQMTPPYPSTGVHKYNASFDTGQSCISFIALCFTPLYSDYNYPLDPQHSSEASK